MSAPVNHGQMYLRDQLPPRSVYYASGRFGRLFPTLPPFFSNAGTIRPLLEALGAPGGPMDPLDPPPPATSPQNPDSTNPEMTTGMTFLGQFLDHDLTFDPTSSLERQNDPESIANFRTPAFELDSVYGSGRAASPHLYQRPQRIKFLTDAIAPWDLPRNSECTALIGDPRNDENVVVSQLHLAFLKFHNFVIDDVQATFGLTDPNEIFPIAQQLVRWHYQWMIVHHFLRITVGEDMVQDVLENGRRFYDWRSEPFIPVEFSVAAYRFGHSQVRPGYLVNDNFAVPIFTPSTSPNPDPNDMRGGVRARRRVVDWGNFFHDVRPGKIAIRNKRIDGTISTPLLSLPFGQPGTQGSGPASLAQRNLLRHVTFSLPSGQSVARAMSIDELTSAEVGLTTGPDGNGGQVDISMLNTSTPLWFYILREADIRENGQRLGPVGGRIVAEVFIGLLQGDRQSYLRQFPRWRPIYGTNGDFSMTDLIQRAGLAADPAVPAGAGPVPCGAV